MRPEKPDKCNTEGEGRASEECGHIRGCLTPASQDGAPEVHGSPGYERSQNEADAGNKNDRSNPLRPSPHGDSTDAGTQEEVPEGSDGGVVVLTSHHPSDDGPNGIHPDFDEDLDDNFEDELQK